MDERFSRTENMFGEAAMKKLSGARVIVFGLGGVGGYTVEALARSGIGALDLVDSDTMSLSNINRQILATDETVGMMKTEAAARRVHSINPDCTVTVHNMFYLPENADDIDFSMYDYIADAIDTVCAKVEIAERAYRAGVPVISAMGAGNKSDPTAFKVADINKTSVCPLAKAMRQKLREKGIKKLKVVYSEEAPMKISLSGEEVSHGRHIPASNSFTPSVMGLIMAGEIIKDLISSKGGE